MKQMIEKSANAQPEVGGNGESHLNAALQVAYELADRWMADFVREARFSAGDGVAHVVFGSGRVESADAAKRAYEVKFEGLETPRTISFKAKLDRA